MRKKLLITTLIIIIVLQIFIPKNISAFNEEKEIITFSANLEKCKSEAIVSETSGLDKFTGLILEPTVGLFEVIIDALMQFLTAFMTQSNIEFVMISKNKISEIQNTGNVGATYTIEDMSPYKNAIGKISVKYPNFSYSPEAIFSGKIDLLDVNFLSSSNTNQNWNNIRKIVSTWYKILRMVTIIGLLSILIYIGIKIIITSNTKDRAKYKEFFTNWIIGVVLAFSMHYIMAFILYTVEEIASLLGGLTGNIEVNAGGTIFQTNLIGLARFQLQQMHFSAKVTYLAMYTALVVYTFKFTIVYIKRLLKMAFLTVISPIIALTYPLDKMNGKARVFEMWLKDYTYNALLQPVHYILYYILVSSALTLAARNGLYAIVALMFISEAERLLKRIFGFDKASGGTVDQGVAKAFATTSIASALTGFVRNPLHPFKGKNKKNSTNINQKEDVEGNGVIFLDDYNIEQYDGTEIGNNENNYFMQSNSYNEENNGENANLNGMNGEYGDSIYQLLRMFRRNNKNIPISDLSFDDGDSRSIEQLLFEMRKYLSQMQSGNISDEKSDELQEKVDNIERRLMYRIDANENPFRMNSINPTYLDQELGETSDLMKQTIGLIKQAQLPETSMAEREEYNKNAEKLIGTIQNRLVQNQYLEQQGGLDSLANRQDKQTESIVQKNNKAKRVLRGVANVGKNVAKPIWDTEKDASENVKRLAKGTVKGAVGITTGLAVTAVQAGISITDGKYKATEGIASFTAGFAGGVGATNVIAKAGAKVKNSYSGDDNKKLLEQYSNQWYNRDDVIKAYNKEFPGKGKEMRDRARKNYVTRGITDIKEQKQTIKYANHLKKERGLTEEEADKLAIATLQYKKKLTKNSNYKILFDQEKLNDYLNIQADIYSGSSSKDSIRHLHEDFVKNVKEYDRVNQ